MIAPRSGRLSTYLIGAAVVAALAVFLVAMAIQTRPVRRAVAAYTDLIGAANRGDLAAARRLCSDRYLRTHVLRPAAEGGLVGIPRNVHPNFRAWRQGAYVWLCPTNRVGPVYQFTLEHSAWKFDGPVGLLRGRGQFVPMPELSEAGIAP